MSEVLFADDPILNFRGKNSGFSVSEKTPPEYFLFLFHSKPN